MDEEQIEEFEEDTWGEELDDDLFDSELTDIGEGFLQELT